MVDVLDRLEGLRKDDTFSVYISKLKDRIERVCKGHIRWLENLRQLEQNPAKNSIPSLLDSGLFAANYWVNGTRMPEDPDGASWRPENRITDTPFQILKLTRYMTYLRRSRPGEKEKDEIRRVSRLLCDVWIPLLYELHRTDPREKYAWPHTRTDGVNIFRLDDHVWLWRCLSEMETCAHEIGRDGVGQDWTSNCKWEELEDPSYRVGQWLERLYKDAARPPTSNDYGKKNGKNKLPYNTQHFRKLVQRLQSKEVQRGVLQRFSTAIELSQTPPTSRGMLAVTRSPRESRFFLHSRDTAIFYGEEWGFFLPESNGFLGLWKNTLRSQADHEEFLSENSREQVLRFGLSVVAGTNCSPQGFKPASTDDNNRSASQAVDDIIRAATQNGFISGYVDATSRSPRLFTAEEERDNFYQ